MAAVLSSSGCGPGAEQPAADATSREKVEFPVRQLETSNGAPVYRKEVLTPTFNIDRIYRSMQGPFGFHRYALDPDGSPELVWMIGYQAVMTAPDGTTPMSQEFMCHSNFILEDPEFYRRVRTQLPPTNGRLFTLAQGQHRVMLPEGFGIPVMSNQEIRMDAQVLNHNVVDRAFDVRHRISIDFVRDSSLPQPLIPLHPRPVFAMKLIEGPDGYTAVPPDEVDPEKHGEGCLIGEDAGGVNPHLVDDPQGRKFTGFWLLPPGREENHTLVTKMLGLPYDTMLHYVAVHLHPFAESIELRDLTTRESVYKSRARQADEGIGLAEVEYFSSVEGIPLYKDHEYEVVSLYNNTSGETQDAMATMFLYLRVYDFDASQFR
jgi:hypothetical protein